MLVVGAGPMARMLAGALTLLVLASPLAHAADLVAPLAPASPTRSPPEGQSVTDPAGDAREYGPSEMAEVAKNSCRTGIGPASRRCAEIPMLPSAGGIPAPVGRDLVGLVFSDTSEALVVDIQLASLDTGFEAALPRDDESASWLACWSLGNATCAEGVWLWAGRFAGRLGFEATYWRNDPTCNDAVYCEWESPFEVLPGSPGTLRFLVPRAFLADGAPGRSLDAPMAMTLRTYATQTSTYALAAPGQAHEGMLFGWNQYLVDHAGPGVPYRLETESTSTWAPFLSDVEEDDDGDVENVKQNATLDILRARFAETHENLTVSFELARVEHDPGPTTLLLFFGLDSGAFVQAVVQAGRGERRVEASICADLGCTYQLQIFPELSVAVGEPGLINLTFSRVDLRYPAKGTLLTEWSMWIMENLENGTKAGPLDVRATSYVAGDWFQMGPAYALQLDGVGAAQTQATPAVLVRDPANDVVVPPQVDSTQTGQYDIVVASIEGVSPSMTRFSLGVQDLSRIALPPGWQAILYAIAVETDQGLFMAGYYKDQSKAQFFCAPDTTVLTEEMRDPAEVIWRTIEGTLSLAKTTGRGGGGASASSIIFNVPHECFAVADPGVVPARQMAAGVYLVPQNVNGAPVMDIARLDNASDETLGTFSMGVEEAVAPAPAWYAQPFGIENFWDITGIVGAVLVSGVGVLAVRRRRSAVQKYMEQIDRAVQTHRGKTKDLEAALVGIRRRLNDDLVRGRLEQAHFFVVEQRLREHLTGARIAELTEAFGDLPHRLLQKLLEVLADGTITREEARRFGALLEDSGLTDESKARIRRKLELWVVEDAANPARS